MTAKDIVRHHMTKFMLKNTYHKKNLAAHNKVPLASLLRICLILYAILRKNSNTSEKEAVASKNKTQDQVQVELIKNYDF